MNAIEIKELTKSYANFTLDNLNLILPQGCIMGLIGENGAGKSTTIRLLLDMIKREHGSITLLGRDNKDNLHLTKEEIGVVLDDVGISECLTPVQVGKIMQLTYTNWDAKSYERYLEIFKLPPKKKFKDFSLGMKKKLGIAVALSHHPKLLILEFDTSAIVNTKKNAYGVEALVQRNGIPADVEKSPVDIEQLFIFMVKEDDTK